MKLKCIGGLADGTVMDVDHYRTGDIVNVPAKIEFKLSSFEEDVEDFRYGRTPRNMSVPYYQYRVCILAGSYRDGSKHELKYLIPHNWHEWEAILFLFRAH